MKKILLSIFLLPFFALAQNQGDATPLGSGGIKILCNSNAALTATVSGDGKLNFVACTTAGALLTSVPTGATSISHVEDTPAVSADVGVGILGKILAIPVAQATDADYGLPLMNDLNAFYTDGVRRNTLTHTQPTVTTATSFTCLAANTARRYAAFQNNSAANIMINLNNGTLTGIVPTSTNLGFVLPPGGTYETPANFSPTAAVTCYQTSGGSINTISVAEGA